MTMGQYELSLTNLPKTRPMPGDQCPPWLPNSGITVYIFSNKYLFLMSLRFDRQTQILNTQIGSDTGFARQAAGSAVRAGPLRITRPFFRLMLLSKIIQL